MPEPYLPELIDDESLDSWLSRVAHGLGIPRPALLANWGVTYSTTESILRGDDPALARALQHRAGFAADAVANMTLERWRTLGLKPDKDKRGHSGGAWSRGSGSRHCPHCLQERGGAFKLHWYLHWSFACVDHAVPLTGTTPDTHPLDRSYGISHAHESPTLPGSHPLSDTQRFINDILNHPRRPVTTALGPRPAREVLTDLGALVRLAATSQEIRHLRRLLERLDRKEPGAWAPLAPYLPKEFDLSAPSALALTANNPLLAGLAITLAVRVLRQPDIDAASSQLWWCSTAHPNSTRLMKGISWPVLRLLSANRQRGTHLVHARFDRHAFDEQNERIPPLDPNRIPGAAWPSVRLEGPTTHPTISPTATSAALATFATGAGIKAALGRLGLVHLQRRISHDWDAAFAPTPHGDRNFQHIATLHQALREGTVPIEYDRRRRTFTYPTPLGPRLIRRIEKQAGRYLTPRAQAFLAWHTWELLTGSDLLVSDPGIHMPGAWHAIYRRQRTLWLDQPPTVLHEIAEGTLLRLRIDEPVQWSPCYTDGAWHLPSDGTPRLLKAWETTHRSMQGTPRPPAVTHLDMSFESAVAFANRGGTPTADQLARRLERFVAVADLGTHRLAADALGVSLATISESLRDLDQSLGSLLFVPHSKRRELTHAGRHLRRVIRQEGPRFNLRN